MSALAVAPSPAGPTDTPPAPDAVPARPVPTGYRRSGFRIRRPAAGASVMPCPECGQMMGLTAMCWLIGPPMRIGCALCASAAGSLR